MNCRAILFDMDGVLFDSMPAHAEAWVAVGREYGFDMTSEDAYMQEGRTGASTINLFARRWWGREATKEEQKEIYAAKCRLFNAHREAPRMPGAMEALLAAKARGWLIGVVTGSGQESLLQRLETNFPGLFTKEHVVSSADVVHGKPSPEPYLKGLEKLGVEAGEAVVVENAPLGVRSAVAARIFTIAVNTGPLPDEALSSEGAGMVLPSMMALAHYIEEGARRQDNP